MVAHAVDSLPIPVAGKGECPIVWESLHALYFQCRESSHPTIGIPDIVSTPIRPGVARGLGIHAMGDALYERAFARISNDRLKEGGRFLPIWSVLRRIPVAALGLKKYLCGTFWVSIHGNNVDTSPLLGDSEEFAVKHTPSHAIPEFIQRLEYDCEVASSMAREKPVDVFEDNASGQASSNEAHKVVKEARLLPSKPRSRPHSRQTDVLARESCRPNIGIRDVCVNELRDVFRTRNLGPVLMKNVQAKRLDFALELDGHTRTLKAQIKAPNSRKKRCGGILRVAHSQHPVEEYGSGDREDSERCPRKPI